MTVGKARRGTYTHDDTIVSMVTYTDSTVGDATDRNPNNDSTVCCGAWSRKRTVTCVTNEEHHHDIRPHFHLVAHSHLQQQN